MRSVLQETIKTIITGKMALISWENSPDISRRLHDYCFPLQITSAGAQKFHTSNFQQYLCSDSD